MIDKVIDYELELCPFCGEQPRIKKFYLPFARRRNVTVECICGANSGTWKRVDKAVKVWNRRVQT